MAWKRMNRRNSGRTTYGKKFRTRKGKYGSYKYVNGRRVGFVASRAKKSYRPRRRY